MDLSTRSLVLLVSLDESGSMTSSARDLGMSQPAVSMQLQRIERAVGFEVFERSARGVETTLRGRLLCDAAAEALRGVQRVERVIDAIRRDDESVLRVGCLAYGGGEVMTRSLAEFARLHPAVKIERDQCGFEDHLAGLTSGNVDVAFGFGSVDRPGLDSELLFLDPTVLCVPRGSKWAKRPSISVNEILDEPILCGGGGPGDGWEDYWLAMDHRGGRAPHVTGRFNTVEMHLDAVARGVGLSIMSVQTMRHYRHPGVDFIALRDVEPAPHWLAWRRDTPSRHVSRLLECARRVAGSYRRARQAS